MAPPSARAAWAAGQIQALLALGLDAQAAQAAVAWVLTHLPADADPDTWIPPPDLLDEPFDGELGELVPW